MSQRCAFTKAMGYCASCLTLSPNPHIRALMGCWSTRNLHFVSSNMLRSRRGCAPVGLTTLVAYEITIWIRVRRNFLVHGCALHVLGWKLLLLLLRWLLLLLLLSRWWKMHELRGVVKLRWWWQRGTTCPLLRWRWDRILAVLTRMGIHDG